MIDPLSPLGSAAKVRWPDLDLPDCFVAAAEEQFFPIADLVNEADADARLLSAH